MGSRKFMLVVVLLALSASAPRASHAGSPNDALSVPPDTTHHVQGALPAGHTITVGVLQGGGALLGFDFEQRLARHFGIQVGAGVIAVGGGITWYPTPGIRRNHWYVGYSHEGIARDYSLSIVGLTHVWRSEHRLSWQLGAGARVGNVPDASHSRDVTIILLYSIGACLPGH